MNEYEEKNILLQKEIERRNLLREKILNRIDVEFNIPNYIIEDIIDEQTYEHVCALINLARKNNNISIENSEILKTRLKEVFNLKNEFDRLIL